MLQTQVNEIMDDLTASVAYSNPLWKDSRFEKLRDKPTRVKFELGRNLISKLLDEMGYLVEEYDRSLFDLLVKNQRKSDIECKFDVRVATLDINGKFQFNSIKVIGFTHLLLLGVEPNEICYKIIPSLNLTNHDIRLNLISNTSEFFKLVLDPKEMCSFESFESDIEGLFENPVSANIG